MSSSSSSVSDHRPHELSVLLSSLLQEEKEHTRRWLQVEMDRTVYPMLDLIFQRLNNKLVKIVEVEVGADLNRLGLDGDHVMNRLDHMETDDHQIHKPTSLVQLSTSSNSSFNHQFHKSIGYDPEFDPEILAQVKREIKEEEYETTLQNLNNTSSKSNQQNNKDCDKYEVNMSDQVDHIANHELFGQVQTLSPSSREQLLIHNMDMAILSDQIQLSNQTIDNDHQSNGQVNNATDDDTQQDWDEPEIEEEGDDGQMMLIQEELENDEEEEDTDEETEIEDNEVVDDKEKSQTVENAPIETIHTQSNGQTLRIVRQSSKYAKQKKTEKIDSHEDSVDNEDDDEEEEISFRSVKRTRLSRPNTLSSAQKKHNSITLALRCPKVGCDELIDKDKFTKHLKQHSIGLFRCLVKDCRESFENRENFCRHLAQSHYSTAQLHCDKCDHHYTSYRQLSDHNRKYHQLGHFKCSFPLCQFTGELRKNVYHHWEHKHKQTLKCQHSGCHYETTYHSNLKVHQRTHLGIKPYKCKWPKCDFISTHQSNVICHIGSKHFKGKPSSEVRLKDFVEFNEIKLLNNPNDYANGNGNVITIQKTQFITHTLQCPHCSLMIAKDEFTKHLKQHSIGQFQCQLKDCGHSFDNKYNFDHHLAQSHQSITQWHCDKCQNHFVSHKQLFIHKTQLHQLGHFQCSFPECPFTGECRRIVINHFTQQHKQTFACSECSFRAPNESKFKQHQRTHLRIRPYRCKWSGCEFAATKQSDTIRHIRRHFKKDSSLHQNGDRIGDPKDFVKVMHELL